MIGRIAPEKKVEQAIAILDAVRRRGHAIRLHLCGQIEDDLYGRRIARLCQEHASWVVVEGRVSGARKAQILASCRFGIQARSAEPFGISVAEMVKAGAIVFAPNNGGQAEILRHPDLMFSNVNEAVEKIEAVLDSKFLQSFFQAHLMGQAQQYGTQIFKRKTKNFIEKLLTADQKTNCEVISQSL
jgi:glycosyltransferase involved in cell wall biosynthesis